MPYYVRKRRKKNEREKEMINALLAPVSASLFNKREAIAKHVGYFSNGADPGIGFAGKNAVKACAINLCVLGVMIRGQRQVFKRRIALGDLCPLVSWCVVLYASSPWREGFEYALFFRVCRQPEKRNWFFLLNCFQFMMVGGYEMAGKFDCCCKTYCVCN